jgi:citrate lyase subunit beta/citryl-CoA lyase
VDHARRLGFGGKLCIHLKQIEAVNRGFSSSEAEVSWAKRVVEAAEMAGTGAFRVDGEMVDRPVVERARDVLARTERPRR